MTVATSDHLEQIIIHGQGCRLISARELKEEIRRLSETVHQEYQERKTGEKHKNYLLDSVSEEMMKQIKGTSGRMMEVPLSVNSAFFYGSAIYMSLYFFGSSCGCKRDTRNRYPGMENCRDQSLPRE